MSTVQRITDAMGPSLPALAAALARAVEGGAFPGAQACVLLDGKVVHRSAHGVRSTGGPPVRLSTLFDVASLTKVLATTAAALVLVGRRELELDVPVIRPMPALGRGGKRSVTPRHLLQHTSGLPAWEPLFRAAQEDATAGGLYPGGNSSVPRFVAFQRARHLVTDAALGHGLERAPGEACVYSDLGFISLGALVAAVAGESLDRTCEREVFSRLRLADTAFFDHGRPGGPELPSGRSIAATGVTRPREPAPGQEGLFVVPPQEPAVVLGEVDDDNAWAMGGVAGHAGLFSTADDVARFGAALVEEADGAGRLAHPAIVAEFLRPQRPPEGPTRALGFDVPAPEGSAAGSLLGRAGPRGAVGHTGFTGCSLWVDLDRRLSVALLTNRVHPTRATVDGIRTFRPAFHDLVVQEVST